MRGNGRGCHGEWKWSTRLAVWVAWWWRGCSRGRIIEITGIDATRRPDPKSGMHLLRLNKLGRCDERLTPGAEGQACQACHAEWSEASGPRPRAGYGCESLSFHVRDARGGHTGKMPVLLLRDPVRALAAVAAAARRRLSDGCRFGAPRTGPAGADTDRRYPCSARLGA